MNAKEEFLKILEDSGIYKDNKYLGYQGIFKVNEDGYEIFYLEELDESYIITEESIKVLQSETVNLFDWLFSERKTNKGLLFNIKNRLCEVLKERYKELTKLDIVINRNGNVKPLLLLADTEKPTTVVHLSSWTNKGIQSVDELGIIRMMR